MSRIDNLSKTLILAATLMCVYALSVILLLNQSIRLDEAQSVWMFTKSIPELVRISSEDVNLPLYGILLHFWAQIFGTEIQVIRMLSLLFFLLSILSVNRLAEEIVDEKTALIATLLYSFSPFLIWYSNEARTYTLLTLITTLNSFFFIKLFRNDLKEGKFGFWLTLIAGLYTHYFFALMILSQIFYLGTKYATGNKKDKYFYIQYLSILGSGVVLFLPWIVYVFIGGGAANTQPLIPRPTSYNVVEVFVNFLFGYQSNTVRSFLVSLWPLFLIILFLVFTRNNDKRVNNLGYLASNVFVPIALVFAISFARPIFLPRYLILVTPSMFILLSWIMASRKDQVSGILVALFLILMSASTMYQSVSSKSPSKEDYVKVTEYLNYEATPEDIVAISAPFTIYPIEFNYKGKARLTTIPEWDRYVSGAIPNFSRSEMIKQLDNYRKIYGRMFVVLSYDQGYEEEIVQYFEKNLERLDLIKFPYNIEVRIYKLRYD